jgi:Zn-dependent protease/predicted transcriptional regulator
VKETIRLGHIAGIRVGANWSVLVIFLLITLGLAGGRFPAMHPDETTTAYVAAGLAAGVLFLLSLLLHELSHAVVARRNDVGVDGITLWLFGGVARLTDDSPDPGADIRIAGIGPLVSLVLAAVFGATALVLDATDAPTLVAAVFTWLALINLVLAVFNLAPAGPLDGGRILRGVLWWRRGDRLRAAVTASKAGQLFGWFLVGVGLVNFVAGAGIGGLWLVLIGWFIANAASVEEQHARVTHDLADILVDDVMTRDPSTVPPHLTIADVLELHVLRERHSSFPVVDGIGRPAGLVTLNRIKQVPAERRRQVQVAEVACPLSELPIARRDDSLADLLPRLGACADGRAIVVEDGRLVGIVTPTDVARQLELADLRRPEPEAGRPT